MMLNIKRKLSLIQIKHFVIYYILIPTIFYYPIGLVFIYRLNIDNWFEKLIKKSFYNGPLAIYLLFILWSSLFLLFLLLSYKSYLRKKYIHLIIFSIFTSYFSLVLLSTFFYFYNYMLKEKFYWIFYVYVPPIIYLYLRYRKQ